VENCATPRVAHNFERILAKTEHATTIGCAVIGGAYLTHILGKNGGGNKKN